MKWNDRNGDGVRDADEPGLPGWTIFADINGNRELDAGEPSALTQTDDPATPDVDEAGWYELSGLDPGPVIIAEVRQGGWLQTHPGGLEYDLELITGSEYRDLFPSALSADGRFVAFEGGRRLVPADTNSSKDIYVFDRQNGAIEMVSVDSAGNQGTTGSYEPSISGDGRYVAFRSLVPSLVPGDTNGVADIFVHDRQTRQTRRVSVSSLGAQANGDSFRPNLSVDGRFVAFWSNAGNLDPVDTNGAADVFVHDLVTGTTELVSLNSSGAVSAPGPDPNAGYWAGAPGLSADGRYVAFASDAPNLVPGDTNASMDVFVRDRLLGTTQRVSVSSGGSQGNRQSSRPSISDDGRYVAFESYSSNLVPVDSNGASSDIFVHDGAEHVTQLVSFSVQGVQSALGSRNAQISGDGRYVLYEASAWNSTNSRDWAIMLHDRATGQSRTVSRPLDGSAADAYCEYSAISSDGRFVAFGSFDQNLLPGVSPGLSGFYVADLQPAGRGFWTPLLDEGVVWEGADFGNRESVPPRITLSAPGLTDLASPFVTVTATDAYGIPDGTLVHLDVDGNSGFSVNFQDPGERDYTIAVLSGNSAAFQITPDLPEGEYRLRARVRDTSGNEGASATQRMLVDFSPPEVASVTRLDPNPTDAHAVRFQVAFSEAVNGVDVSDFQLAATGLTGSAITGISKSGDVYTVTVQTGSGVGSLRLHVRDDNTITDIAGKPLGGPELGDGDYTSGETYSIERIGQIWGMQFDDYNANGIRDPGEPALPGWTILLDANDNGQLDAGELWTTTDSEGYYAFSQLARGAYVVTPLPQSGWRVTAPKSVREITRIAPTESVASNFGNLAAISGDGRFITFRSESPNLIEGDTNGRADIFVLDRQLDTLERVSVASDGTQANSHSHDPAISADGRYVAFRSEANNLVPGDTNNQHDIFVRDRATGQTRRASVSSTGAQSNGFNSEPILSTSGRYVVFHSGSTTFITGDTNGVADTYLYDLETGVMERVSIASDGSQGTNNSWGGIASSDGSRVLFESTANNLVPGDTNNTTDVFLRDRQAGTTQRISVAPDGTQGNSVTRKRWISGNGRFAVLESSATNFVPGDTNNRLDIFLLDLETGDLQRISVAADGTQSNGEAAFPQLSSDGRYAVFESTATNLVSQPTGGVRNVYRYDRLLGILQLVSAPADASAPNGHSFRPYLSADGQHVVFHSSATNLVPGDTNGQNDVFVADLNPHFLSGSHVVSLASGREVVQADFGIHQIAGPQVTLIAPTVTNDTTPEVMVWAIDDQPLPDGTPVALDVDLNFDGEFLDAGEWDYVTTMLSGGSAALELVPALAEGTYGVRARVTDSIGDEGISDIATLTIDVTPPLVTVASLATPNTTPTITGTVSEGTLQVQVDGRSYTAGDGNLTVVGMNWTLQIPPGDTLAEGTYDVIASATDAAGNTATDGTTDELLIDFTIPAVTMVSVSDVMLSDADVNGPFTVTVSFSTDMDIGVIPLLTFQPSHQGTLANAVPTWTNSNTFTVTFAVVDREMDIPDIHLGVSGARSAAGRLQEDYTPRAEFSIDMRDPVVSSVAVSDTLLSDADAGGPPLLVTVRFRDAMDHAVSPTISFSPAMEPAVLGFLPQDSGWTDPSTYVAAYAVSDANVSVNQVRIGVAGARDPAGNAQLEYTPQVAFSVDMESPVVTAVFPLSLFPFREAIQFRLTFSESVTGLDAEDFALTTTGLQGADFGYVSGSGSTYSVVVGTGEGNGTIRLDVIDNDSIRDPAGNPLGGIGVGNGDFDVGEVCVVDKRGEVHGKVWDDRDADGVRDPGERGTAGVTVFLDLNGDGLLEADEEPWTITSDDDPGTLGVDEAGDYHFLGVEPGTYSVVQIVPAGLERTFPGSSYPGSGELGFLQDYRNGDAGIDGLDLPTSIAISPDDKHVYVTGYTEDSVAVFHRDSASGGLSYVQLVTNGTNGVSGLNGAEDVVLSPDGRHVYVAGYLNHALAVFSRDLLTGELSFIQAAVDGQNGVHGLDYPRKLAVSPGGEHIYAAAGDGLVVFRRKPETGEISFVQRLIDGANGGDDLAYAYAVALSPDGRHVYAAGHLDDAITAFARDATTGELAFVEAYRRTDPPLGLLDSPNYILISPDGEQLYVTAYSSNAMLVFHRDATSGRLAHAQTFQQGVDGAGGLWGAQWAATSADGVHVYTAGASTSSVGVYRRNVSTGLLQSVAFRQNHWYPVYPRAIAVSPDGRHAYTLSSSALVVHQRLGRPAVPGAHEIILGPVEIAQGVDFGIHDLPPRVVGRHVFYNASYFDGEDPAADAADDGAIATDKSALLPGGTATFANYTSYGRGINGIMVDIAELADPDAIDGSHFEFRAGNSSDPSSWPLAPPPNVVAVRAGAGAGGSDRVTLIWPDGAIARQWLQITVKADAVTGLLAPDVFYFGNAIGDSGNSPANAFVDGSDFAAARDNYHDASNRAAIDFTCDYNRDSFVDGVDLAIARDHGTSFLNALKLITTPSAAAAASVPPAPAMPGEGEAEDAGPIALWTRKFARIDAAGSLQVDARSGEVPVGNPAAEPGEQSTPNDWERPQPSPENRPLPARKHSRSSRGKGSPAAPLEPSTSIELRLLEPLFDVLAADVVRSPHRGGSTKAA